MLTLHLLGDQDVLVDGHSLLPKLGRRSLELIAFLAVHEGNAQPRQTVASLFWPESSDAQALTNLRRELHVVRQALAGEASALTADARTLRWNNRNSDTNDVAAFMSAVDEATKAGRQGPESVAFSHAAELAMHLYKGPFMPNTYQDWVLEERDRMQQSCLRLLDDLIELRARSNVSSALDLAQRRVVLEPLAEAGYQTLMRLQGRSGDRAAAMRTYHRCVSVLDRELGLPPDSVTTEIYEQLASTPVGGPNQGPHLRSKSPDMVGRSTDVDGVISRWEKAAAGDAGMHLITGEAGIGKSRLLDEFTSRVERLGATVAVARCPPRDGQAALGPVAQWLADPVMRTRWERLDDRWRSAAERLASSAAGPRVPGTYRPPQAPWRGKRRPHSAMADAWQRPEFFEGLARALIDPTKPTVLVIDDLHWCDEATASWLPSFLDLAAGAPLLVVAAARSDELDNRSFMGGVLSRIRGSGLLTETMMTSLSADETAVLAGHLLGVALTPQERERWQQATGGSPLFIIEIARSGERTPIDSAALGQLPRIQAVLERRLDQLSPTAQDVAALASCVGRDFSLELLLQASDLPSDEVIDAVDEMWRRRIVRARNADAYDFSHDLIRDCAYQRIAEAKRRRLHLRVARALESIHAEDPAAVAAALALQYAQANVPDRAVEYHLSAANGAAAVFANGEAVRHYERGLEILQSVPPSVARDATELRLRHAMSAPLNAEFGYASQQLRSELERTSQLAESLDDARQLLLSLAGLFAVRYVQGDVSESFRIAERSLVLRRRCPDVAGQAHFTYGGAATSLGRHEEALPHFAAAHALCIDQPPSVVGTRPEVHGRAWSAHALWLLGRDEEAVYWSQWAIDRAEAAAHPYSLAVALAYATITHQLRRDVQRSGDFAERTRQLCARYHFAYYGEWGTIVQGWCLGGHAGIDQINQGLQALRAQGALVRQPYYLGLLADALLRMGNTDQAGATVDAALSAAADHADRWWVPELWRLKSLTCDGDQRAESIGRAMAAADRDGSRALRDRITAG